MSESQWVACLHSFPWGCAPDEPAGRDTVPTWPVPAAPGGCPPNAPRSPEPFGRRCPPLRLCACGDRPLSAIPGRCDARGSSTPSAVLASPTPLSVVVSWRRSRSPKSPSSVPSTVPSHDISFPPQGLLGFGFPCFLGTTKCSDARSSVSIRFVVLRSSIPFTHSPFAPDDGECRADGPGGSAFRAAFPRAASSRRGTIGPPTFLGNPLCLCPALRPRRDGTRQAFTTRPRGPRSDHDEGSTQGCLSGLNHTAWALAVYASPRGLPHHDARLASGYRPSSTGRAFTRRVPSKGFSYTIASSFPKLRGARSVRETSGF